MRLVTSKSASALNPSQRSRDLERMESETFDVVVIGGGVTGTGAALDAASRGLKVALIEQRDYASGTSSRSSKLFHGGLRYLEQLRLGLVREALRERDLMFSTICPHLIQPVSFVYPLMHRIWERPYVGMGVLLYNLITKGSSEGLPRHEHLSGDELAELAPAIDEGRTYGAVRYWDGMVDDARHTMTLARTAAAHGAVLASSTRVVGLLASRGVARGVEALDLESGRTLEIEAAVVVNATGVWNDDIQAMAGGRGLEVRASKGVHLVVPRDRIRSSTGMILRTKASVLFVIPFGDHWIIGTTDTPWELRRAHPAASSSDIVYILKWANTVLAKPLSVDDVVGVYAGLRPLLAGESDETSKLSREHAVVDNERGLVSVAGGKYTTYRVMACDAIDAAAGYLDRPIPKSVTHTIPLVGADGFRDRQRATPPFGLDEHAYSRLVGRYGSLVDDVLALIGSDDSMAEPVVEDARYMRAEMVYAATHEGALHLDDFLTRRTRMSIETEHRGAGAASGVSELVADRLGWDERARDREVEHYLARVAAERDSQNQETDRTADAARMGAPDVRTGRSE